jgi:hypothetical protein
VDNYLISWIDETFSYHNAWPIYLSKLDGLSTTNPYGWITMLDIRGIPTPICPCCHSTLLRVTIEFDPQTYEIAGYLLDDAQCVECKCLITAPTPLDHPDYEA